ncbi:MAG: polysaccharide biosynthesis/export family protein [Myxococcota bacterium]
MSQPHPALVALALCFASMALLGCGEKMPAYPYAEEPDPRGEEYVIGVADGLNISVWKNGDLNTQTNVRPDGTITMPLIGDLKAAGMRPSELKAEVSKRLAQYLRAEDIIVSVAVSDIRSYFVTVAGNVAQPGRFTNQSYLTVLDAMALAGGPNRFADASDTVILRKQRDGSVKRIPINYEILKKGRGLEMNLVLLRGDQVFVP